MSNHKKIASDFLQIGATGFGGPVAVIAMMEGENKRKNWVEPEEFQNAYAICKLLPGPVAVQMAIYLGDLRGGRLGGVIAGVSYILPSFILVLGLGILYRSLEIQSYLAIFLGLQGAALTLMLGSVTSLFKPHLNSPLHWTLMLAGLILTYWRPDLEPLWLMGLGIFAVLPELTPNWKIKSYLFPLPLLLTIPLVELNDRILGASQNEVLWETFWICFKAATLVFGTGFAVVPFLSTDFVDRLGWVTTGEFLDALTVGQITPGPVVITATFLGLKVAGVGGAIAASLGIFLPSFFNILVVVKYFRQKLTHRAELAGFTRGVIAAVVGGVLATFIRLLQTSANSPFTIFTILICLYLLYRAKWSSLKIIFAGGFLGLTFFILEKVVRL